MESEDNILLLTDSYKITHYRQYPPGTTYLYSYFESRGGIFPYTVFYGLQYILKKYFTGKVLTSKKIQEAKSFYKDHFGEEYFDEEGWIYILKKWGGYLPFRIMAVPEGTIIPTKNVLFTVENTDPKVPWITSFFEALLVQVWYPLTVATNSRIQKQIIHRYLMDTQGDVESLPFQLHDFGFRGASSVESAAIGGSAHLVNFKGSDTVAAISLIRKMYGCEMAGFSIPASEHSTITTWGKDFEKDACKNMIESFPNGIVACVSDSYDIFNCCENIYGKELKDLIIERGTRGGRFIVRPDSGDPAEVVIQCLEILGKHFEVTVNSKGFRVLPHYLGIIQGDGISFKTLGSILETMKMNKWSAQNITFGSGGALLQKVDRDTQKCAYKCSFAVVNGVEMNVYKEPITDLGKASKKGRLTLEFKDGVFITMQQGSGNPGKDIMVPVFENGILLVDQKFDKIRERAEIGSNEIDILTFLEEFQ